MLNIIYIVLLILILIYISPIIDHFLTDFDDSKESYEIIVECTIQLIIIGLMVYILYITNESSYIKNIFGLSKYDRMLIDIIFTIVFIGTQKNLIKKLDFLTHIHPIRNIYKI